MTILPVLFAVLASCSKGELIGSNNASSAATVTTVNKAAMLQLVNEVRQQGCNCGGTWYGPATAVIWNNKLETAAYNHSNDMYQKKYFSHTAPDGSNAGIRIERAGYLWQTYGENIAVGYHSERDVVNGWLSSPGHCKNIMNPNFREMGVARVGTYWTQEFGKQ